MDIIRIDRQADRSAYRTVICRMDLVIAVLRPYDNIIMNTLESYRGHLSGKLAG